jgi:hypothetical protein
MGWLMVTCLNRYAIEWYCRNVSSCKCGYYYYMYVRTPSPGIWRRVHFVNRRFGGTYRFHVQGRKICERRSQTQLQPPAQAGSSLADFSTLKMEAIHSSETSVHTRSIQRHIPEDCILQSHRRETSHICPQFAIEKEGWRNGGQCF